MIQNKINIQKLDYEAELLKFYSKYWSIKSAQRSLASMLNDEDSHFDYKKYDFGSYYQEYLFKIISNNKWYYIFRDCNILSISINNIKDREKIEVLFFYFLKKSYKTIDKSFDLVNLKILLQQNKKFSFILNFEILSQFLIEHREKLLPILNYSFDPLKIIAYHDDFDEDEDEQGIRISYETIFDILNFCDKNLINQKSEAELIILDDLIYHLIIMSYFENGFLYKKKNQKISDNNIIKYFDIKLAENSELFSLKNFEDCFDKALKNKLI